MSLHRYLVSGIPERVRRGLSRSFALLLALVSLAVGSCVTRPMGRVFEISGYLGADFGCYLISSGGKTYELNFGRTHVPVLGSRVRLLVRTIPDAASGCMVGTIVDVILVRDVKIDFRTRPVTGSEVWGPERGPIVIGQVEVVPGAELTILPSTEVRIEPYGALRVRGTLHMVGAPGESIYINRPTRPGGPLLLESAHADTRIAFASITGMSVSGAAPDLEHLWIGGLSIRDGRVALRHSSARWLSATGGGVTVEDSRLGNVDGIHGEFTIDRSILDRLDLSYSRADVRDSRFEGSSTSLVFHGTSGGTLERNVFAAQATRIEVRHDSTPVFRNNDFPNPVTIVCESRSLASCVEMRENWWGTADANAIRARFATDCLVCFEPWLDAPFGGGPTIR